MAYRSKSQKEAGGGVRDSDRAFGEVVRRLRLKKGRTQEALAWESGMSRVYISETERGLREPSLTTVLRLGKVLGVSAAEIVAEVEKLLTNQ